MKNSVQFILSLVFLSVFNWLYAQVAPAIEWQKCLGGIGMEEAFSIRQTMDGGYIVAGYSTSSDGDVLVHYGCSYCDDYWIVKVDDTGNIVWRKTLGGSNGEHAWSVQPTIDGGYIVAGFSGSNDVDVTDNHGGEDYWIVKLDTVGDLVWQKSFGGEWTEQAFCIQQTNDDGFIIAGYTNSIDGFFSGNHGLHDYYILKLDPNGNLIWQKLYGGSGYDHARSIEQTTDGGFVIAGWSESNNGDVSGNHGSRDAWIIKTDSNGLIIWQKCFGGSSFDWANSVQQTSDGGYIVAGVSDSQNGDVSGNHGIYDYWILKLDMNGNLTWQKSLGGEGDDQAYSTQQTYDGGYIIAGWADSKSGDVSGNHDTTSDAYSDVWLVKLDESGNLQWQKCYGGSLYEGAFSIQQTSDSGYILAGETYSSDGDVSGYHSDSSSFLPDYWIVKLLPDTTTGIASILNHFVSLYPNPVQSRLTITLTAPTNQTRIQVYDVQGRMMLLPISFQNDEAQLQTDNLPDGFYTLIITDKKTGRTEVEKFVKQK